MTEPKRVYIEPWKEMHQGMVVTWHTDDNTTSAELDYRVDGSDAWHTETSETNDFPDRDEIVHRVVLTGLVSDTIYEFRAGDGEIRRFRTWSENESAVTIASASDHQQAGDIDDDVFRAINSNIAAKKPDLFVINGDIVNDDGGTEPTAGEDWAKILDIIHSDILEVSQDDYMIPFICLVGNHDVDPHNLGENLEEPDHPPLIPKFFHTGWDESVDQYHDGYGYFTAGDWFAFVMLDTHHNNRAEVQSDWLENIQSDISSYEHVVAAQHIPRFPSVRPWDLYDFDDELRERWHPIFQEMGVKYVLIAHEHIWSLSPKIFIPDDHGDVEEGDDELVVEGDGYGIRYIGGGSWHSNTGPRSANNTDEWWIENDAEIQNSATIEISKNGVQHSLGESYLGDQLDRVLDERVPVMIGDATLGDVNFGGS